MSTVCPGRRNKAIRACANCPVRIAADQMTPASCPLRLHMRDALRLLQTLPRQTQYQRIELLLCQRHRRSPGAHLARPDEAPGIQPTRCAPHAKAVVHQQLDAGGARIGEQVAVMGLGTAKDLYHAGQQPIGAGAHVRGLSCQP